MLNTLLMTSWLCLPIAPINPIEEDTLPSQSFHVAVGLTSPNGIVATGPTLGLRYEMLVVHPFILRGSADGRFGRMKSRLFPQGDLYAATFGVDAIYYRGTDHITGYIGLGLIYALHHFDANHTTADSLYTDEGVTSIDVQQEFGYRFTVGLKYHSRYSLDISVSELRPDFKKTARDPRGFEGRAYQTTRTGAFRISFGYRL